MAQSNDLEKISVDRNFDAEEFLNKRNNLVAVETANNENINSSEVEDINGKKIKVNGKKGKKEVAKKQLPKNKEKNLNNEKKDKKLTKLVKKVEKINKESEKLLQYSIQNDIDLKQVGDLPKINVEYSKLSSEAIEIKRKEKIEKEKLIKENKEKERQKRQEELKVKKEQEKEIKDKIRQEKEEKRKILKETNAKQKKEKFFAKIKNDHFRVNEKESYTELDNAANIYPAVSNDEWSTCYRVSAFINESVEPEVLQKAVEKTVERFPFYNVTIKKGLFWHYFERLDSKPSVKEEELYPCSPFDYRGNKQIFRVLYFKNRISYEGFHAIGDGYGAIQFLNCILMNYFELKGNEIKYDEYGFNPHDLHSAEESEDAFDRYADLKIKNSRKERKAYQIKGPKIENGTQLVVNGIMDVKQLKEKAKEKGCSLNEFLSTSLLFCINEIRKEQKVKNLPAKLDLPINLRRFFPSKTLKNFSSYTNFEVDDLDASWEDVLQIVKEGMASINEDYLMGNMNANVGIAKNWGIRMTPLFFKDLVMQLCYKSLGDNLWTMVMSNLGVVPAPKEFADLVDHYEMMMSRNYKNAGNVAVCSFNGKTVMTFVRIIKDAILERKFFRLMQSFGIDVKIESNY